MSAVDAAAAAYKTELHAMQNLLSQQRSMLNQAQILELTATQASAFATRAAGLRGISCPAVAELTTMVQSGPWTSDQQSMIVMSLASAMDASGGSASSGDPADRRQSQTLAHFFNYTTAAHNATLTDPNVPMMVKIETALEVLTLMHATLLRETSKRHVLSVLCALHANPNGWRAKELRQWYLYFKKQYFTKFKGKVAHPTVGHILKYPEKPSLLGPRVFGAMYNKGVEPVGVQVSEEVMEKIAQAVWCRGNAVALRDENELIVSAHDLRRRGGSPAIADAQPVTMQHMMMMNMMSQQQFGQHGNPDSTVDLQMMRPKSPKAIDSPQSGTPMRSKSSIITGDMLKPIEDAPRDCDGAPTDTGPQPGGAGAEHAPVEPGKKVDLTPEEQADRFMRTMKGHAGGDDTDDDDETDGDDDVPKIKAKPAAKSSKVKAKPAVAKACKKTGPASNHHPKAPVTGWPIAKRMKKYPNGCGKCRYSPGCTRSCFYYRGEL